MVFRFSSSREPRGDSEEGKESKESGYVQKLCVVQWKHAVEGAEERRGNEDTKTHYGQSPREPVSDIGV